MDRFTPLSTKTDSPAPNPTPAAEPAVSENHEEEVSYPDDAQSRMEYIKSVVPPSKPKRKWPAIALLVVVGIGLVAAGGYFYSKHHTTSKPPTPKTVSSQTNRPKAQSTVSTTTQYVSNGHDLNLTFTYPSNWIVTPLSGNNPADQTITLNSPLKTITNSAGATVTGKVTVSIRPGSASMTELASGTATAGQASVQFAYTNPTSAQFKYPYLTFIDLPAGANPASAFQEVLITGTTQFAQNEAITASSVSVDPIITASFYSCTATTCTGSTAEPLSITNDTWLNNTVFQQTLALFESLQLN